MPADLGRRRNPAAGDIHRVQTGTLPRLQITALSRDGGCAIMPALAKTKKLAGFASVNREVGATKQCCHRRRLLPISFMFMLFARFTCFCLILCWFACAPARLNAAQFYNDWAATHLANSPGQTGPLADPDQDGETNLVEFAFGTDPLGEFGNNYNNSIDAGIDISYHPIRHFAFFFNSHYDFLKFKDVNYSGNAGYIEMGVGGRAYIGKVHEIFFVEAGFGNYIYYYTSTTPDNPTYAKGSFGIKAGIGGNMPVSGRVLLLIKMDFHMIFTSGTKTYFTGIYGGVRFIL